MILLFLSSFENVFPILALGDPSPDVLKDKPPQLNVAIYDLQVCFHVKCNGQCTGKARCLRIRFTTGKLEVPRTSQKGNP